MTPAPTTVRTDFFLDLTCVHSYIGFTRFERAARAVRSTGVPVDVVFHPHQVAPDATERGEPLSDRHARDFGDKAAAMTRRMALVAADDGLELHFERAVFVNTLRAHALVAQAAGQDRAEATVERLFRAYFTDGLNIADPAVLRDLAAESGVDPDRSPVAPDDVRAALAAGAEHGVTAVPRVEVGGQEPLVGAHDEREYGEALSAAAEAARTAVP
ncbi:DsbA family protein [Streptomyces sp. NPDC090306]|uniref:DsbA family oxidoreductase n=1 Tax=unclassified Streptomyces TaxID=2593676 RepID=UPI0036E33A70